MQVKIFVESGSDQWEELEMRYLEKHPSRKDLNFDPSEKEPALEALRFFQEHQSPHEPPPYMGIHFPGMEDIDQADLDKHPYLGIASICTSYKSKRKRMPGQWHHASVCHGCGNVYPDFEYDVPYHLWKPPAKQHLFAIDIPNHCYAREEFIAKYEAEGLSGLSFHDTEIPNLYRVRVAQHEWQNTEGVCEMCGMKTNCMGNSFFNLPEEYSFDIQTIHVNQDSENPQPIFIVSQKAFWFLEGTYVAIHYPMHKEIGVPIATPILPGYLSDLIAPPNRMFRNGEYPTSVFRE